MDASQYIKTMATMAGIDPENEQLQEIIGNETLATIDVNDDLVKSISSNLMTMDSAKANSELNKHFRATILNGLDAETNGLMDEYKLSDDVKATINAETNSFKRVKLLTSQVQALEIAKAGAGNADTKVLNDQITELNSQIAGLGEQHATEIATINDTWGGKMLQSKVNTILSGYNYALEIPTETNVLTAQTLVNTQLNKDGLSIVDANGVLSLKTSENTDHFVANKVVSVKEYMDAVLGANKLLKVTDGGTPKVDTPAPTDPPKGDGGYASEIDRMIAEAQG